MTNSGYNHLVGFKAQRMARMHRAGEVSGWLILAFIAFLMGRTYEAVRPTPDKAWCGAVREQIQSIEANLPVMRGKHGK